MSSPLRSLLAFMRPYRSRYVIGLLSIALTDTAQLAVPWVLADFADDYRAGVLTAAGVWRYTSWIVGLALVTAVFRYFWRIYVFGTSRLVEYDVRQALAGHLLTLSAPFYQRRKTGDLMAHATNDLTAVRTAAGEGVLMLADSLFLSLSTLTILLVRMDLRLVLVGLLPLPLLAGVAFGFSRLIHHRFSRVQEAFSALSERAQENIAGVRVVRSYVQEEAESAAFHAAGKSYLATFMRLIRVQGLIEPAINFLAGVGFVLVIGYGGLLAIRGDVSLGDFISFEAYLGMLIWPMIAVGWVLTLIQRGLASMQRIQALLDEVPEVRDLPVAGEAGDQAATARPLDRAELAEQRVATPTGRLEVRGLTFGYGSSQPPVLREVFFEVWPGRMVGIVGRTGSGKSTLAALLARLWNTPPGSIRLDGRDLAEWPLAQLRAAVNVVPQDAFLFSKTIAENIALAPEAATDLPAIRRAAEIADVDQDVMSFPNQYQTLLGERGVTVSGGQRQRLAIARALMRPSPVLVLDDCLSAVDSETERRILAELEPVLRERAAIVISHRCSAVVGADEILVLDDGRVVERGSHAALLALDGEYARLWRMQQLEEGVA